MSTPNLTSSLRKQGPITTGFRGYERSLPTCLNETTRRMGPCFRRDDAWWRGCSHQTQLSSPRKRGPSIPKAPENDREGAAYWIARSSRATTTEFAYPSQPPCRGVMISIWSPLFSWVSAQRLFGSTS